MDLTLQNAVALFLAALLGGALNAVAGGGSFIAFPALIFTGVPPIPANATNTVALWTGLAFSGGAFRHHLKVRRRVLFALALASVSGGALGALLLLRTPAHTFMLVLPWLMLAALLLFVAGGDVVPSKRSFAQDPRAGTLALACFLQLLVAIYGGYFGGGMGIVILALLAVFGMADIHEMNALKTVLSSATNGLAVLVFVVLKAVFWPQAVVMICGAALGGYFAARYSLRMPRTWIRRFVIVIASAMTVYFFVRGYALHH